jgi:2-hydroxy-6-oxonona-2,4-dienedioate hydrolase
MHQRSGTPPDGSRRAPVVLVHGIGVSSRYMVPLARLLAERMPVHAPDLPGFGRSGKPRRVLQIGELAGALAAWADAAGLRRAVLVANSFGCQVAVHCAVRHPRLVEALVLLGPTMDPDARDVPSQFRRWLRNAPREPLSLAPLLLRDYLDCGPRRLIRTGLLALADPIERELPRVAAPTLVVRGEHDHCVPQRWAERVAALLPSGRLAVAPGAAHTLNYNAPRQVAALLEDFLVHAAQP